MFHEPLIFLYGEKFYIAVVKIETRNYKRGATERP